jgi:hypothetical protein
MVSGTEFGEMAYIAGGEARHYRRVPHRRAARRVRAARADKMSLGAQLQLTRAGATSPTGSRSQYPHRAVADADARRVAVLEPVGRELAELVASAAPSCSTRRRSPSCPTRSAAIAALIAAGAAAGEAGDLPDRRGTRALFAATDSFLRILSC